MEISIGDYFFVPPCSVMGAAAPRHVAKVLVP